MLVKNNLFLSLVQISFYFLPISLIIGSLIVNINILIFVLLGSIYLINQKIIINFNLINTTLLLFFLTVIISTLINIETLGIENFVKSIFLLKFFLIYILLESLILNDKINIQYFFNICLGLIIFISADLALQFFSGKNILGYQPWEGRITGIFEHEAIAGAFIQKIFIFSLISIFMILHSKVKARNLLQTIFFTIIIFGSFVASNRISFVILISLIFFIIIFYKSFRKNLLISLIVLIPVVSFSYKFDPQINHKYQDFINKVKKMGITTSALTNAGSKKEKASSKSNKASSGSNHGKIYLTTVISFNESKLLGHGLKSFRINCRKFLDQKDALCSTHPHNYHLEILHDTGIIGFCLISIFAFLLLFSKYKNLRFSSLNHTEKIIISLLALNFMIEIFPIKSTGSLFTTWNGTLLWLSIALVNYGNKKITKNEKTTNH